MKKYLLLILFLVIFTKLSFGQDTAKIYPNNHHFSGLAAISYIPKGEKNDKRGIYAPVIGLEYEYLLNHSWAIGIISSYELKEYSVNIDGEDVIRENSLVIAIAGFYHLTHHFQFFFGPGIEIETHKNLFLLKTGFKYSFDLQNDWDLTPFVESDIKEKYATLTLGLSIGKKF